MLELERAELMPVPAPFDGYVERPARVSSTCLVSVGRNRYSVPCEYAGKWVSSRLYPTRIEVVADDALIAIRTTTQRRNPLVAQGSPRR